MLESLNELRDYIDRVNLGGISLADLHEWGMEVAEKIENEVDANYMPLPLDADGVPIHIGDEMMQNDKRIGSVTAVGFHTEPRVWVLPHGCYVSIAYTARGIVHYKPRTVEDVLEDFSKSLGCKSVFVDLKREAIAKYAAELRMREAE